MALGTTLTVIVFAPDDVSGLADWHRMTEAALVAAGWRPHFVYTLGDRAQQAIAEVRQLGPGGRVTAVRLPHWYDEAMALQRGLGVAQGEFVATLPAGGDIDVRALPGLVDALAHQEMVLAVRGRSGDPMRRLGYRLLGLPFADPGCRTRAFRRSMLDAIADRSTSFALLPRLAGWHGYEVGQVLAEPARERRWRLCLPTPIALGLEAGVLDLSLGFARRPLQLFGLVGVASLVGGLAIAAPLILLRLLGLEALADQPALIPGLLMVALGIQCAALGLLAELLVFARRHASKETVVAQLVP